MSSNGISIEIKPVKISGNDLTYYSLFRNDLHKTRQKDIRQVKENKPKKAVRMIYPEVEKMGT